MNFNPLSSILTASQARAHKRKMARLAQAWAQTIETDYKPSVREDTSAAGHYPVTIAMPLAKR